MYKLIFLFISVPAMGVTLNPSMTTQQIQSAISSASGTVTFSPGNYSITAPIQVPCNNLQITGPAALTATFTNNAIFLYPGNCQQLGSISYLTIASNGGVYVGIGNNSNFSFTHNTVTGLVNAAGVFFDGTLSTTLSNVTVQYNTFGDPNSCAQIFASTTDMGGYCAGLITSQGTVQNLKVTFNQFTHVEEGIHLNQMSGWNPGGPGSVCISCVIDSNAVLNYHRIGIEIQVGTPNDSISLRHNAVVDPLNSSYGTFAASLACCQWGKTMATNGFSPGFVFDDNLIISTQPAGSKPPPYGVEFWGNGVQGLNSLVEGNFSNGYTWGFGAGSWTINGNYICGPNYPTQGGYISNQQGQNNPPAQTGNVISPTCQSKPSVAPTVTPAAGTYATAQTVTLADSGPNTSIWYTLDGTTPIPGKSALYTQPFSISQTATLKAVGMWGNSIQPTSYPAGYGYTPSTVVSATYTINAAPPVQCTQQTLYPNGTYKTAQVPCS